MQVAVDDIYRDCCVRLVSCELHPYADVYYMIHRVHGAGLTREADCLLCAPGKYQTGVGLMAEANCSLCVAGKYHSGSGLNAAPLLCLLMHRLVERVRMTSALASDRSDGGGRLLMVWAWQVSDWGGSDG